VGLRQPNQAMHAPPRVYGFTWNSTLLISVRLAVITLTLPVVAPVGTVVEMRVGEVTLNTAAAPC
jgi:hypothetical protein